MWNCRYRMKTLRIVNSSGLHLYEFYSRRTHPPIISNPIIYIIFFGEIMRPNKHRHTWILVFRVNNSILLFDACGILNTRLQFITSDIRILLYFILHARCK